MLKNIKSIYYIKLIFYYLQEKRKLYLIKYNKNLQNLIDINLLIYKIFSGRYIIYQNNSQIKGKEYNSYNDKLIFEGKFLNGERHGKGKEYDYNGNIVFEGEYLNGKKNGKGKEFDRYGNLIFKGEYIKGKKWNGKGYNSNQEVIYNIKNGEGNIMEYDPISKLIIKCKYLNGEKMGKEKNIII